jgi:hypothetical protein
MAENQTLEQELIRSVDADRTGIAATTAAPPMQHPIFGNISLVVPKKRNARQMETIAAAVERLMGAYRRDQFENPHSFVSQVTQCLEQFPDCVIESVTSPKGGLQTECAWPPNLTEIRVRCERSLKQYTNIALANARKQRAAEEANKPKALIADGPKADLTVRNDANAYWLDPARKADHPADRFHAQRKPWVARPLKELAAEVGKTLTDEEISKLPNNPPDLWKKLKAS